MFRQNLVYKPQAKSKESAKAKMIAFRAVRQVLSEREDFLSLLVKHHLTSASYTDLTRLVLKKIEDYGEVVSEYKTGSGRLHATDGGGHICTAINYFGNPYINSIKYGKVPLSTFCVGEDIRLWGYLYPKTFEYVFEQDNNLIFNHHIKLEIAVSEWEI